MFLKEKIIFLFMLFMLSIPQVSFAGLLDYPTVAVLPFENKGIVSKGMDIGDANLVSEFVIEDLIDSGMSSAVDTSTASETGKLVGAKYLIYGNVTGLTTKESGASASTIGAAAGMQKHKVTANISARIIDVETGRIVLAGRGTGESSSANFEFSLRTTIATPYDGLIIDVKKGQAMYGSGEKVNTLELGKITIGTTEVSMVQVHNAIEKAVEDLIYGKDRGLITKIKGEAKVQKKRK